MYKPVMKISNDEFVA